MIAVCRIGVLRGGGRHCVQEEQGEKLEEAGSGDERRSFLRKAAVTALGGAVATLGLETSTAAKASTLRQGKHIKKPDAVPAYQAYCCNLLYHYCTVSQEKNCGGPPNSWSWTCCAYVGSSFLVLSNSCSTCQPIGSGLAASASRWESASTVLVASDSEQHGQEWAASVGLDSPRVERGRLTAAANLTSLRQLEVFVDGFATN